MLHIDLKKNWLRQETQARRLVIKWIPSAQNVADSFTKLLKPQQHKRFIYDLGLRQASKVPALDKIVDYVPSLEKVFDNFPPHSESYFLTSISCFTGLHLGGCVEITREQTT